MYCDPETKAGAINRVIQGANTIAPQINIWIDRFLTAGIKDVVVIVRGRCFGYIVNIQWIGCIPGFNAIAIVGVRL